MNVTGSNADPKTIATSVANVNAPAIFGENTGSGGVRVRLQDKVAALERLARYLGLFPTGRAAVVRRGSAEAGAIEGEGGVVIYIPDNGRGPASQAFPGPPTAGRGDRQIVRTQPRRSNRSRSSWAACTRGQAWKASRSVASGIRACTFSMVSTPSRIAARASSPLS
jgi:hypothetical protein